MFKRKHFFFEVYHLLNPRLIFHGLILGSFVTLFTSVSVYCQISTNNPIFGQPNTFGIGPRAMGMGGAFTAVADDASAAYWNVAGLAQLTSYELSISSAPVYFQDNINGQPAFGFPWYASMQFMIPVAEENTFGISLFRPFHPQQDYFAGNSTYSASTRQDASYLENPSFQESDIELSYAAGFSALKNFSVGVDIKRITNDPYYIRYFANDATVTQYPIPVMGFGVDVGLLYRIPITKYSEEVRVGLALNDVVSNVQYTNGITVTSPVSNFPATFSNSAGLQLTVPAQISLGIAYKNDYLFKIRNITAFDFEQIADADFPAGRNEILRFGTEFWFFRDVIGVRAGYSTPLYMPGYIHLGLSVRALKGDFEADLAFIQPLSPSASVSQGSSIATVDTGGINFEPFDIGLTYRFGGGEEIPPPKVGAYVRPPAFTPSQSEKATFFLDTTEDVNIHHWSVLIYDQSNHLVRGLRGSGSPPTKLLWGGENDQYEPLPPGVYTWAFQVQDQLDHVGSTPVQTVEILGPTVTNEGVKDPSKLLAIRQQQQAILTQERQQLSALAQESLKKLLGTEEGISSTVNAMATPAPIEANGNTNYPALGLEGVKNLTPGSVINSHREQTPFGNVAVLSYQSKLGDPSYVEQEVAGVMKDSVNSVGTADFKYLWIRVYYGSNKNELSMETPTEAAANYASGRIDLEKLKQLSEIHINGIKVGSNGY